MTYPASDTPHDGFVVEIDGQFNSEYGSITAAFNAGLAAMQTHRAHNVRVVEAAQLAALLPQEEFHWWMVLDEAPEEPRLEIHLG